MSLDKQDKYDFKRDNVFMDKTNQISIQAKAFDFALTDLVRSHRDSFQPLWTVDSWVKFLIWMALNCGLNGERESLELFSDSLGAPLTSRMRRLFFERTLEDLALCVLADPAENTVLIFPSEGKSQVFFDKAYKALKCVGLSHAVSLDRNSWIEQNGVISIPWKSSESKS